jgi:sepiapterin reductase
LTHAQIPLSKITQLFTMAKLLLVVTGASRGLGRAIAKAFCNEQIIGFGGTFHEVRAFLVARSQTGLQETEDLMLQQASDSVRKGRKLKVDCSQHVIDLGDLDTLDSNLDELFKDIVKDVPDADHVVFINNAGSLGHLGPCAESPSLAAMRANVDLNITSALWTSVRFARFAKESSSETAFTTIVNISSLAAIQVFPTMGIYAAGKAARNHYHATLAKELHGSKKNIRTLNYAPGPLETDMVNELRSAEDLDTDLKSNFLQQLVNPDDSARELALKVLERGYESGEHIDYYDLLSSA